MPLAEQLYTGNEQKEAEFTFIYDYACGALQSLRARIKFMEEENIELPNAVACWANSCKFLVDKFHFSTHKGAIHLTRCTITRMLRHALPNLRTNRMMSSGALCKKNCNPYIDYERAQKGAKAPKRKMSDFVNSQKQEQSFKDWNKHKDSARKMRRSSFLFMGQMNLYYSTTR
jgi:hypothetical protein